MRFVKGLRLNSSGGTDEYSFAAPVPPEPEVDYLCFTANAAGSTVKLNYKGTPTAVSLETSIDGSNWTSYTMLDTITLSNIGDKVYFRNTSETTTGFSTSSSNRYNFNFTGDVGATGDVTTLINKNGTDTLVGDYCFYELFDSNTAFTHAPKLPAINLTENCYVYMFYNTSITNLPDLPAINLPTRCYANMFSSAKTVYVSESKSEEYINGYRIPSSGTGISGTNSLSSMFSSTSGTFKGTPSINQKLYAKNDTEAGPDTPSIFHNATLGLISLSSDGTNRVTISDKNLGAITVYNDGDALSEDNCGKYYQWGNNYGFPFTGSVTKSSTRIDGSGYGPGNYYSSSTFICNTSSPYDWSNVSNNNLWGGTTGTLAAMQGPCPSGFHLPTYDERATVLSILSTVGLNLNSGTCVKKYLKLPPAGLLSAYQSGQRVNQNSQGYYWSATASSEYNDQAHALEYTISYGPGNTPSRQDRQDALNIRPFKNTPTIPDSTRTVLR